jgi:hypothetical protein
MNLFDFTEEEMKLNRRRQISPRQREWLNMTAHGIRSLSGMNAMIAASLFCFLDCVLPWGYTFKMKIRVLRYFLIP